MDRNRKPDAITAAWWEVKWIHAKQRHLLVSKKATLAASSHNIYSFWVIFHMSFVRSFIYLLCYLIIKQESTEENWSTHACGGTEQRTGWWKCCSCHGNDGRWSFRKWDQFVLLLKITWQDGAPPPLPLPPIQPCRAAAPVSYYKMAAQSPPPTRKPWTLVVRCYLFQSTHVATGFAARLLSSAEFTS